MEYKVELTSTAEEHYDALYRKAEKFLCLGQPDHPSVSNFEALNEALQCTLPNDPYAGQMLAGVVSYIHKMSIGSFNVSYQIKRTRPVVVVLVIDEVVPGFLKRLGHMLERGDMNGILITLGIKSPLSEIDIKNNSVM